MPARARASFTGLAFQRGGFAHYYEADRCADRRSTLARPAAPPGAKDAQD